MDATIAVRIARPSDLAAVDALFHGSFATQVRGDYPPSVVVTALPVLARANPRLLASGTYLVAEDEDGAILGAGGWTAIGPQGARRLGVGHVRHLVTDHRRTRRGVASGVMDRVVEQARAAGMRALDCLSTRGAVPFYAAIGFQTVGPVDVSLRPGIVFPAVRMIRRL
jgi:GNAT superfamily N-acetyltransferase